MLRNLGLDRLINIYGSESTPASIGINETAKSANGNGVNLNGVKEDQLEEVPCPVPSRAEAAPTILEAHEALMQFDPRNVPKFKDVVEFLREDLGQSSAKQ